jgi:hypothetical protein
MNFFKNHIYSNNDTPKPYNLTESLHYKNFLAANKKIPQTKEKANGQQTNKLERNGSIM